MANPSAYEAVLFDLDGTLLDTAPDFVTALNTMLRARNLPPMDPAVIRAGVTHGSAGLITLAFGFEKSHPEFEPTRQAFLGYYRDCLTEQTRLFPGMEAVLAGLAEHNIPWGIVTNKPEVYTRAILKDLWLPAKPGTVICPDHVARTKPDPEPVLLACAHLKLRPQQTLFVGDHLRDIQAGISAGCHTASAAYGYLDPGEDPHTWGADYLVEHAYKLTDIIFPV